MRVREHACWWCGVIVLTLLFLRALDASSVPNDPVQAHQWADAILGPEFEAAFNRFRATHPLDRKPGTWDHVHRVNPDDVERWQDAERKFEELRRAMRRAGY